MKGIIVVDNPKDGCRSCFMMMHDENKLFGFKCSRYRRDIPKKIVCSGEKPEWCPINSIPGKKEVPEHILEGNGEYETGWNDCIDKILKGAENGQEQTTDR